MSISWRHTATKTTAMIAASEVRTAATVSLPSMVVLQHYRHLTCVLGGAGINGAAKQMQLLLSRWRHLLPRSQRRGRLSSLSLRCYVDNTDYKYSSKLSRPAGVAVSTCSFTTAGSSVTAVADATTTAVASEHSQLLLLLRASREPSQHYGRSHCPSTVAAVLRGVGQNYKGCGDHGREQRQPRQQHAWEAPCAVRQSQQGRQWRQQQQHQHTQSWGRKTSGSLFVVSTAERTTVRMSTRSKRHLFDCLCDAQQLRPCMCFACREAVHRRQQLQQQQEPRASEPHMPPQYSLTSINGGVLYRLRKGLAVYKESPLSHYVGAFGAARACAVLLSPAFSGAPLFAYQRPHGVAAVTAAWRRIAVAYIVHMRANAPSLECHTAATKSPFATCVSQNKGFSVSRVDATAAATAAKNGVAVCIPQLAVTAVAPTAYAANNDAALCIRGIARITASAAAVKSSGPLSVSRLPATAVAGVNGGASKQQQPPDPVPASGKGLQQKPLVHNVDGSNNSVSFMAKIPEVIDAANHFPKILTKTPWCSMNSDTSCTCVSTGASARTIRSSSPAMSSTDSFSSTSSSMKHRSNTDDDVDTTIIQSDSNRSCRSNSADSNSNSNNNNTDVRNADSTFNSLSGVVSNNSISTRGKGEATYTVSSSRSSPYSVGSTSSDMATRMADSSSSSLTGVGSNNSTSTGSKNKATYIVNSSCSSLPTSRHNNRPSTNSSSREITQSSTPESTGNIRLWRASIDSRLRSGSVLGSNTKPVDDTYIVSTTTESSLSNSGGGGDSVSSTIGGSSSNAGPQMSEAAIEPDPVITGKEEPTQRWHLKNIILSAAGGGLLAAYGSLLYQCDFNVAKTEWVVGEKLRGLLLQHPHDERRDAVDRTRYQVGLPEALAKEVAAYFLQLDLDKSNGVRRSDALALAHQLGFATDTSDTCKAFIEAGNGRTTEVKRRSGTTLQEFAELFEQLLQELELSGAPAEKVTFNASAAASCADERPATTAEAKCRTANTPLAESAAVVREEGELLGAAVVREAGTSVNAAAASDSKTRSTAEHSRERSTNEDSRAAMTSAGAHAKSELDETKLLQKQIATRGSPEGRRSSKEHGAGSGSSEVPDASSLGELGARLLQQQQKQQQTVAVNEKSPRAKMEERMLAFFANSNRSTVMPGTAPPCYVSAEKESIPPARPVTVDLLAPSNRIYQQELHHEEQPQQQQQQQSAQQPRQDAQQQLRQQQHQKHQQEEQLKGSLFAPSSSEEEKEEEQEKEVLLLEIQHTERSLATYLALQKRRELSDTEILRVENLQHTLKSLKHDLWKLEQKR